MGNIDLRRLKKKEIEVDIKVSSSIQKKIRAIHFHVKIVLTTMDVVHLCGYKVKPVLQKNQ